MPDVTLARAKTYTDQALGAHVDKANPHPQYVRIVDSAGNPTGGEFILIQPGESFPPAQKGSVLLSQGGIYIADQVGTAWVQLGKGPLPVDNTPPTAPANLRSSGVSTTGFTVTWDASSDAETGVDHYEVALGAAAAFAPNGTALTKAFTGLTSGTGYTVRVRAVDAAGNASTATSLQVATTSPADTTPPGAPPSFRTTAINPTSVTLAWNAAVDAGGVARYEVSQDSTTTFVSVGNLLTKQMTGLAPSSSHTFRVRAVDNAGNVSPVSQLTVTTGASSGTGTVTTLMGINRDTQGTEYTTWDVWRVYGLADAQSMVSAGAKIIALSDDPNVSRTGGATSANQLRTHLMSFYGKTGTPSKNATIETHFGNGNEVDRETLNATQFADTYELMETVIADFPMASLWFDATRNKVQQGVTRTMLNYQATSGRRIYQMLDGLAGSYYPPGAFNYPNVKATDYNTPASVIDLFMALHVDLGIAKSSIWEYGHCLGMTPPPAFASPGSTYQDLTKRATYTQQFLNYWFQACLDNRVTPVVACYWDQQIGTPKGASSNVNPDVRLLTDQTRATPDTATVWRTAVATFNAR